MAENGAANGGSRPGHGSNQGPGAPKKPAPLIRPRPIAGRVVGALLALVFALVATPIILTDTWLAGATPVEKGEPAPITIRVPHFAGFRNPATGTVLGEGPIVVTRGQRPDRKHAALANAVRARQPGGWSAWLVYGTGLFLVGMLFTGTMRRSHRGRLLRTHLVNVFLLLGIAVVIKAALLVSPMSVLAVPIGGAGIVALLAVDLSVGISTALVASLLVGMLVPFDPGVITVLAIQGVAPVLILGQDRKLKVEVLLAGLFGGLAAGVAYSLFFFLAYGQPPLQELAHPIHSAWLASAFGGVLSSVIAVLGLPLYTWLLGDITKGRLVELEDLSNPLLKQIAERAPGTWQHSLAMANMAEIAANEIGANGRLVRVGAYYHDLGKSLQPKYYIENLAAGESSPHDNLPPPVSTDAIFAHVTEGVRMARKQGLPERVVDFMHMHHGDGLLEYFWSKCQEQGNPDGLTEEDFRYPGVKPQNKETAILAICDAVEAASRTLRNPDEQAIQSLVQRIVYGKLHLGQLDDSGLTVSDLRRISNSLRETIKHAHHGRIEYPWQKKEREEALAAGETPPPRPAAPAKPVVSTTQRLIGQPPLDSLDVPRPYWRERRTNPRGIEIDPTERIATDPTEQVPPPGTGQTVSLKRGSQASEATGHSDAPAASAPTPPPGTAVAPPAPAASTPAPAPAEPPSVAPAHNEPPPAPAHNEPPPAPAHNEPPPAPAASQEAATETPPPAPAPEATAAPEPAPPEPAPSKPPALVVEDPEPPFDEASAEHAPAEYTPAGPSGNGGASPAPDPSAVSEADALADWEDALESASWRERKRDDFRERPTPPPPPPGRRKAPPATIELMKSDAKEHILSERPVRATTRSDSEDGTLSPGMVVLGPPPATHSVKSRSLRALARAQLHDDETVEREIELPTEATRPSDRPTTQHNVVLPPEAFPEETSPSAPVDDDDEPDPDSL